MAKKATRRSREPDPDLEDPDLEEEVLELEDEPAPKKSTGKKKRRSADDLPAARGEADASAKRKRGTSATHRPGSSASNPKAVSSGKGRSARRASQSGEEELNGSGRRKRPSNGSLPARRKQGGGVPPVVIISVITCTVLLVGVIIAYRATRQPPVKVDHQEDIKRAETLRDEGIRAFRAWNKAKAEGLETEQQEWKNAHTKLTEAMDVINAVLDNPQYKDPQTGELLADYAGWTDLQAEIAPFLYDLGKGSVLGHD